MRWEKRRGRGKTESLLEKSCVRNVVCKWGTGGRGHLSNLFHCGSGSQKEKFPRKLVKIICWPMPERELIL